MPEITATNPSPVQQRLDRRLLLSLMLSPLAAGINTIVGFTVAHWITISAYKRTGYLVSFCDFALCVVAAILAWSPRGRLANADETVPQEGRQVFMAKLALLLAGLCLLVVIAGTFVLITLRPND